MLKQFLNDNYHTPVGTYLLYHGWWFFISIIKLPVSIIFLFVSAIYGFIDLVLGSRPLEHQKRRFHLVVVTGCDSGFGRDLAISLTHDGFEVVAGCMNEMSLSDLEALGSDRRLHAVHLDVTDDDSVRKFEASVSDLLQRTPGLAMFSLVNNAGVGQGGLVDWCSLDSYKWMMEVKFNYPGHAYLH